MRNLVQDGKTGSETVKLKFKEVNLEGDKGLSLSCTKQKLSYYFRPYRSSRCFPKQLLTH